MEVKPVEWKVQPLFYKPLSYDKCLISFDGKKYYTFLRRNIDPEHWLKKMDYIIEYTDNEFIKCDGYYDRDNKVVGFFSNQKIYKLCRDIVKHQKLERLNQTFLISDEEIKERNKMSPILDTKTTDEIPTPQEGKTYTIVEVEQFTSAVKGYKGLRVSLKGSKGKEYVESLWVRDVVGPKSKLGSFMVALGKDTDKWMGKSIKFVSWSEGKRSIEAV